MPDAQNSIDTSSGVPDVNISIQSTEVPGVGVSVQNTQIPVITLSVNASQTVQAPVDATLTISGKAADAKVAGDAIREIESDVSTLQTSNAGKVNKPATNGTAGQILKTNGDGTTDWIDRAIPTDEQTAAAIDAWLDDHPEATTTVEDGSITYAKLNQSLKELAVMSFEDDGEGNLTVTMGG